MKKLYALILSTSLLIGGNTFGQTFTFSQEDFYQLATPGTELILGATLINNTSSSISMRVTRQQDVMGDAPTWTSAFCMDVCYLPTTDSVNYTFNPMDTVHFTFHFYTDATPDNALAKMRWKNVNNPANTFNADFFGSTDGTMAVTENHVPSAKVNIYPMPVPSGNDFTLAVSNVVSTSKKLLLEVYDIFGKLVKTTSVIEGINFMALDLPAGVYAYSLVSETEKLDSGKLVITQ